MKVKRLLFVVALVITGVLKTMSQATCSFVVTSVNNNYSVMCNNPSVVLTTSVTDGGPLSFTWLPSCSGPVNGPVASFTQNCTGQVIGTNTNGCSVTQTFAVFSNFTSPTIAVSPTVASITCSTAASTFTGTSNLGPNVTTNWYQIAGSNTVYVGTAQGTVNVFQPSAAGIYWFESVNNINGCRSTRSVEVTVSVGIPQFTVTSSTNFTIGCASTSITSMQVSTVLTSPVLNTPVSYTFLPPGSTVVITPTTVLGPNPNMNNITTPGLWVVYVKDLTNSCLVSQSVSVIQNTIAPNVSYIQPLSILKCKDPKMVLTGISNNPNTTITWTVPAIPSSSVVPAPTTTVNINSAVANSSANVTVVGIFTVGALDNNNQCRSSQTLQINQDLRLPVFSISAQSNSVINCKDPNVLIVPVITPTLASALVPTYTWYPPVGNPQAGTQFNSTAAGSHTAISMSTINGCTTTASYIIASDLNAPALNAQPAFTLDCANNPTVAVYPSITGTTTGFTYSWTVPPSVLATNLTNSVLITNGTGNYSIVVTNTINGCKTNSVYLVVPGALTADFNMNPSKGYAPLVVTFNNASSTSTGASSIISTWSYGNGAITQTVLNTDPTESTYKDPGTYTVQLIAKKGACIDTVQKILVVETPSKMEVPNVFTPNGDKVNDVFRIKAASLAEIDIKIYDRWGNIVYQTVSETGNIAWDGNNLQGKECAPGTYFYVIIAKGKDDQSYEQKGNVSLFR